MSTETIQIELVPVDALVSPGYNPRKMSKVQGKHLQDSMHKFGLVDPLIVNRVNGHVVGGNQRLRVAKAMGLQMVPVVFLLLSEEQERELNIRLNANTGEWDFDHLLAEFGLAELASYGMDEGILVELQEVFEQSRLMDQQQEPPSPEPLGNPQCELGKVYLLGKHRLMCGDSANPEQVRQLIGDNLIHLVHTDPPYNVKVEPRSSIAVAAGLSSFPGPLPADTGEEEPVRQLGHHQAFDTNRKKKKGTGKTESPQKMRAKDRPLLNDFLTEGDFSKNLDLWFQHMSDALVPGGAFYLWGGYANCANYPGAIEKAGLYFSQAIIWVKGHPVLTRKDFMGNHEWCFYGWKKGGPHQFYGPNNIADVWEVKKVSPQNMVHLTEKPLELAERAMTYSSLPGQGVLDLFGGSGSTLMAAEHLDRVAFLMELDPHYCDVIVDRWEKKTGLTVKVEE